MHTTNAPRFTVAQNLGKVFLVFALLLVATAAHAQTQFTLLVGQQQTVDVTGATTVSVGNPDIASASLADNKIILSGKAAGITSLTVIDRNGTTTQYTIEVLQRDPEKVKEAIDLLLADVEGIETYIADGTVVVDGFVFRDVDLERVEKVVAFYGEGVMNLSVFSRSFLALRRLIQIDYYRYEVQQIDALSLGVNWRDFFQNASTVPTYTQIFNDGDPTAPVQPGRFDNGGQVVFTSDFNPVSMNQDDNSFKLLDNHQVIVKDGATAEYHVGGEFPIVYITQNTATIDFKTFGAIFNVTPEVDRQDNINLLLDVEISKLDESIDVLGYPGFNVVRQVTEVNMKSGETVVIGGYLERTRAQNENGLPGLSQIPVLGYFFGNKAYTDTDVEGVVFITPSLATPSEDIRNDPKIRGVLDEYESTDYRL